MKKLLLVFSLILIGASFVQAETVTYTEFTEKTDYGNGHYKLVSGVSNMQDESGQWIPFTQAVTISYHDYALRFSYNQYWVEYEPYVIRNGNKYTLEWIINNFPNQNIRDHIDFNNNRDYYKWALTIKGIPSNLKEGVTHIGFDYKDSNNLSWSDIVVDGNFIIIKNKIMLSVIDLRHHNYTVDMNRETMLIGNLDGNYWYHGVELPHWVEDVNGNYSITFDPTVEKQISQSSDDALSSGLFYTYDDDDISYFLAQSTSPYITGWIFQDVTVPADATITSAELEYCMFGSCAGTGNCYADFWGATNTDIDTFSSGVFEPKDLTATTETVQYFYNGADTANGLCAFRSVPATTDIIQEIVDLAGWDSGDNMAFRNTGSVGRGNTLKTYTYDLGSAYGAKLTIEYTVAGEDYSFSFSYPASGCSNGKGCTGEGCSACTYAYFEPTDLTGTSTETEVSPYGQTATLAFIVVDNQSSSSDDFNMSIDLNATAPSGAGWLIKLKLSTITGGWESTCSEEAETGCILVDDTNKNIGTINYSASTQDKNFFFFSDFQSVNIGSWDRNGTFYSYGTT